MEAPTGLESSFREEEDIYLDGGQIYFLMNRDGPLMLGKRVPSYRTMGLLPGLDFAEVLIFKVELSAMSVDEEPIDPSAVLGKAVVLNNYASVINIGTFSLAIRSPKSSLCSLQVSSVRLNVS